jgi:hypothetical protein
MATSKKLTVINTTPVTSAKTAGGVFDYWGNQAENAYGQGWRPTESGSDYVRYKSTYDAPFNDVFIPDAPNERGRIEVIGKKGNKMDIIIADKQGNIRHTIHKDVTPDFVQNYITNSSSTVQQRMDNIKSRKLAAVNVAARKTF